MLEARLQDLTYSSTAFDQRDQKHALEIKRLRQDIDALHNEKEGLRRYLVDADKERQELQDNFIYVKGQLDKVQVMQAQSSGREPQEEEIAKVRQALRDITEEKNRLNHRVEGLCREIEKEKTHHENSLERVMTANARLMEEKDRTERECRRIAQLYAESTQQAGDLNTTAPPPGQQAENAGTSAEELRSLEAQIAQVNASIQQREQENESLKNRIRKLAISS